MKEYSIYIIYTELQLHMFRYNWCNLLIDVLSHFVFTVKLHKRIVNITKPFLFLYFLYSFSNSNFYSSYLINCKIVTNKLTDTQIIRLNSSLSLPERSSIIKLSITCFSFAFYTK